MYSFCPAKPPPGTAARSSASPPCPTGAANPEGITVDRHGDVYVTTFAVTGTPPGRLFVFDDDGHLKREVEVAGSSNLLLGVAFHPEHR